MKYVRFNKDFWSFRKGDIIPTETLTRGRARLIVARGFAEFTDKKTPTKKKKPKPVVEEPEKELPDPVEPIETPEQERAILPEVEQRFE